jgi:hypothetical protein
MKVVKREDRSQKLGDRIAAGRGIAAISGF